MAERTTGTVKWFNAAKGFGFIVQENGPADSDIFVHYSVIQQEGFRTLKEGQTVEFELFDSGKGLQAKDVKITVL